MSHYFVGDKCSDCGKTIEELFYILLEQENEEALRYNYNSMMSGSFSEAERRRIVITNHKDCLSPEEKLIKDIIE